MDRRSFLALGYTGTAAVVSGCVSQIRGSDDDKEVDPDLPDGMAVETAYTSSGVLGDEQEWFGEPRDEHHVVLSDAGSANERVTATDPSIESFVESVDFEQSYLLIVQNAMHVTPDLVLSEIERVDGGLHVEIAVDYPGHDISDDLRVHSLLIAITDERDGVPETLAIDIQGYA